MPMAEVNSFMQTADIDRDIRSFLVERFLSGHAENLRDGGSLLGDVVDSLGILALVTYLQDHFQITVDDEDVIPDNLDTVNNLVAFVARKLGKS
jgi:acyl carrier protein